MQESMGVLYSHLCHNHEEMSEILRHCQDPFIDRLLEVAERAVKSPHFQPIHFGKLRSDFMIDKRSKSLQLIEYNTIAAGMGCIWSEVRQIHSYLQSKYPEQLTPNIPQTTKPILGRNQDM